MLAAVTNPLLETTAFGRTARGDLLTETRPDLEVTAYAYDGEGHTTSVTPPDKPAHAMAFNAIEQLGSYNPPSIAQGATSTTYSYDLDRMIDSMTQPGPRLVDYDYDSAGRLDDILFPTGSITRSYSPTTGRVVSIGGPSGVTLSMTYDGSLQKSVTFNGAVSGTVAWDHDTDFRVVSETVNGAWAADFAYDPDSLLTSAGDLVIVRDPESGRVDQLSSGAVVETRSYNEYGELSATATTVSGTPLLSFAYQRDALGRITQKTETEAGVTTVTDYAYDTVGRLTQVDEGGVTVEAYTYDANGNRLTSTNSAGSFSATYDDQDRIQTYGSIEYSFTLNGELLNKTDTSTGASTDYVYDAVGNLREVTLPNGDVIEYLADGQGRRVGKLHNGVLERAWLWRGQLQPVAELDGAGNVVARFVYAEGVNVPELMVTSTATYRLVKDHLGSVREVVDVATSTVAQTIRYDAWGRVLVDTNPGFQPFGFAGGLYDRETGLVRFGARDYDAKSGVWLDRDPLGLQQPDGPNLFAYSLNDPANRQDERGLFVGPIVQTGLRLWAIYRVSRQVVDAPPGFPDPFPGQGETCVDEDFEYCRDGTARKTRGQCCDDVCEMRAPGHHGAPPGFPTPYTECLEACMTYGGA
jgi:RHS repeat-associated protein